MKITSLLRPALLVTASVLVLGLPSSAGASTLPATNGGPADPYTCYVGNVPPGTYGSVVIAGVCRMSYGNITVLGNLTVNPGALLDAVTPGDPTTGTPVVPATVVIDGNVFVGAGGVLLFGCSPNISCGSPPGISFDRIAGNLTAIGAQGVVVHSASIGGSVSLLGGGGGPTAETCEAQTPPGPVIAALEPWSEDASLDYTPVYSDFEDSTIGGNLTVTGLTSCWLGSLRNQVGGSATYTGNTMGDPDAMEIDDNLIGGNMTCVDNTPGVQFGDSGAAPNIVVGLGIGECAFDVVLPNPAPEADQGLGTPEDITVSPNSLGTYRGLYTSTNVTSLPTVATEAGDSITANLDDFLLVGTGLNGSGTYNPLLPPGLSGEVDLATKYPDGSESFTIYDTCNCRFDGQSGVVQFRAYGTTSPGGSTSGTFLITSGGPFLSQAYPTIISTGKLGTLAGYGTFSGLGNFVQVTEHLGFA